MKKIIIHGLVAGILSGVAGIIYLRIYQSALAVDFSKLVRISAVAMLSLIACLLMACGYAILIKLGKPQLSGWLNLIIAVLSFASIIGPFSMSLPVSIESPELFPGLIVPLHFFPALTFFAIAAFFQP